MDLLVWDIDDVLNELMREWLEQHWLPLHAECCILYQQISANPPHEVLGVTQGEYLTSLDEFRIGEVARLMRPHPKLVEWFATHGQHYRHVALTARPLQSAAAAAEWTLRHFGDYVRTFSVVPSRLMAPVPAYDQSKREFLDWLGKSGILIDDSEANVEAARSLGMRGVLFPQPWNSSRLSIDETLALIPELAQNAT
jgi:FMN phosphatase YigB (HAD superfamily)